MISLAPGLLSTTTGCPSSACSRWATARATTSVPPPGGYGTIRCTGRAG
ncbi:Uncharacterised protein [Bordetella pertussis]|nr:Uncharacterised protein [Bordetella pertussis]